MYRIIRSALTIFILFTILGCDNSTSSQSKMDSEKTENIQSEECIENDFTHSSSPLEPTITKGCAIDLN